MLFCIHVEFEIHAPHVEAFREAIVLNASQSLSLEPGCRQFDVLLDPADDRRVVLYELYDDAAAFAAHLQSAHFLEMNARTAPWVVGKTVRTLHRLHP